MECRLYSYFTTIFTTIKITTKLADTVSEAKKRLGAQEGLKLGSGLAVFSFFEFHLRA